MKIRKDIIISNSFKIKVNKFEQPLILDNRERKYYISMDDTDSIYLVDTIDISFKWCKDDYGTMIYLDNDGFAHRDNDLPAMEDQDGKAWCQHGILHLENGPAIEYEAHKEWFIYGQALTEEDFNQYLVKKTFKESLQSELNDSKSTEKKRKI